MYVNTSRAANGSTKTKPFRDINFRELLVRGKFYSMTLTGYRNSRRLNMALKDCIAVISIEFNLLNLRGILKKRFSIYSHKLNRILKYSSSLILFKSRHYNFRTCETYSSSATWNLYDECGSHRQSSSVTRERERGIEGVAN